MPLRINYYLVLTFIKSGFILAQYNKNIKDNNIEKDKCKMP
jgi:hypothetical protein